MVSCCRSPPRTSYKVSRPLSVADGEGVSGTDRTPGARHHISVPGLSTLELWIDSSLSEAYRRPVQCNYEMRLAVNVIQLNHRLIWWLTLLALPN